MNERERTHLAALEHAVAGARAASVVGAGPAFDALSVRSLAHQAAMLQDGFLGRFRLVRDRSARALPLWSKDMPGYGIMLSFHGFGCEESGDYGRAEDELRAAAELEPYKLLAASHRRARDGNDRAARGRTWLDERARGVLGDARQPHAGPHLVA